ncbi:MAG: basic secretory protein-like protein [Prolixibacteraceae bacterium]|jgi:PKD repeat protein
MKKGYYLVLPILLSLGFFSCAQTNSDITDLTGGEISSQYNDSPVGESTEQLTDNDADSKFLTFHSETWIMYHSPKSYVINRYSLTSGNDAPERDPMDWQLEGSHNGVTFYPIDKRQNQSFASRKLKSEFVINNNSESYSYFRLSMVNNSGKTLQLSELELFGNEGEPYTQLMADFRIDSYLVTRDSVSFTNASLNATSLVWTFDGGEPNTSTLKNSKVVYSTAGEYKVTLTATDGTNTTSKTETITIKDINDWSSFIYPAVDLECSNTNNAGYKKYLELIKENGFNDIKEFVQHCCLIIAQNLYFTVDEANEHGLRNIHYLLTEGGALSYKNGDLPDIEIGFDMNYLNTFASSHSDPVSADEIYGILCHEICHGYQNSPKNCGVYGSPNEYYGFIEGTADLARLLTGGFNPPRYPKAGGSWIDGYNTTAFFYQWVQNTKSDEEFLKKFNKSTITINPWSADKAFNEIFGEPVQSLWDQYQAAISTMGATNEKTRNFTVSINESRNTLSLRNLSEGKNNISIYDIAGSQILTKVTSGLHAAIDISQLPKGIYLVKAESKNILFKSEKFIK